MLRAGLVGLGMMGRHHARVLRNLEGVELTGVSDSAGDLFGVAKGVALFETADQLLDLELDLVIVATPTASHLDISNKFITSGINTFVEKPLAHSVEAAEEMVKNARQSQVIGAVGHIERFNSALIELKKRIEAGQIGEIYQISTVRQGGFPPRVSDVGVAKDLATHDIDLTGWLSGSKYASVSCNAISKAGGTVEDLIVVSARLDNGVLATHHVNWLSPLKERKVTVIGSLGVFVADLLTSDLTFYKNGAVASDWDALTTFRGVSEGDVIRYAFMKREPLQQELEAFRDAILGLKPEIVSFQEGLEVLKITEACLSSSSTGQTLCIF